METNQTTQGNEGIGLLPDSMKITGKDHPLPTDEDLHLHIEEDGTPLNTKEKESTTPGLIIETNHLQPTEAGHELEIQGSPTNILLVVYKASCIRQSIQM